MIERARARYRMDSIEKSGKQEDNVRNRNLVGRGKAI